MSTINSFVTFFPKTCGSERWSACPPLATVCNKLYHAVLFYSVVCWTVFNVSFRFWSAGVSEWNASEICQCQHFQMQLSLSIMYFSWFIAVIPISLCYVTGFARFFCSAVCFTFVCGWSGCVCWIHNDGEGGIKHLHQELVQYRRHRECVK